MIRFLINYLLLFIGQDVAPPTRHLPLEYHRSRCFLLPWKQSWIRREIQWYAIIPHFAPIHLSLIPPPLSLSIYLLPLPLLSLSLPPPPPPHTHTHTLLSLPYLVSLLYSHMYFTAYNLCMYSHTCTHDDADQQVCHWSPERSHWLPHDRE